MTTADVVEVGRDAIWVLLMVASPIMAVGLIIGLTVALFQALTQIQEMTLVFVPKIIANGDHGLERELGVCRRPRARAS